MYNEDAEQPGGDILIIPVLTIEVTPDEQGWLQCDEAVRAIAGSGPNLAGPAAVLVRGELAGCGQPAAAMLAAVLYKASAITVYGRGHGVAEFLSYLRNAIAQERAWRAREATEHA
jgi:hypothetical protein